MALGVPILNHFRVILPNYAIDLKKEKTSSFREITVKIQKFGTPQTIVIIVLKIEKFDATLH